MATYKCPDCGAPCLTPKAAANHCAGFRRITYGEKPGRSKCPLCRGTGEKAVLFGPNEPCPLCHGSGEVDY